MASADERRRARCRGARARCRSGADEIQERYLRRAICEINELGDELLALGDELHVPVLGSGHPLGDVFLLKHRPRQSEIQEGVAFFGRRARRSSSRCSGSRSTRSRSTGPTASSSARRSPGGARWLTRELHIVQPKLVVAMGDETVAFLEGLDFPLSDELDPGRAGEIQRFTPTIGALVTPDIDASLDEQSSKTRFWNAFKALGAWWSELPPY